MKTDKYLAALGLSRNQAFFAASWFNMVHEHSLDSFRVRAMNPRNALRELARIYELGKSEERAAVRAEAHEILSQDLVLKEEPYADSSKRILALLASGGDLAKNKEEGHGRTLLLYFITELSALIEARYIQDCLSKLAELLVQPISAPSATAAPVAVIDGVSPSGTEVPPSASAVDSPDIAVPADTTAAQASASALPIAPPAIPPTTPAEPDRFDAIYSVTGHLLSTLIDRRASLESLFKLYSEVLVPRRPKSSYSFSRRFGLAATLLTQPASNHHVAFALENVTAPQAFPSLIGGVTFAMEPPFQPDPDDKSPAAATCRKYLTANSRRLFASKVVRAQDPRAAGAEAADAVNDILNLVRFEYERSRITMPEAFAFVQEGKVNSRPRVFSLPAVVPNPSASMDGDGLASFVASVDELVLKGSFKPEGRDRVQSAFRLYRTGLDSTTLENKLVNWWTALEYLVRGSSEQNGGIGKSVETLLAPVLCNAYIAKHLLALRAVLIDIGVNLVDPASGERITLKGMSAQALYTLFKRADIQPLIMTALSNHIFVANAVGGLLRDLGDPARLHDRNAAHEQRLRWHLQRLWRARCDIVHSAERTVSAALLCANLEYYLKTVLMTLLRALREIPTLTGPKEFFDRQGYMYGNLQQDLKSGRDGALVTILAM